MKALNQYIQESILDDDQDIDNKKLKVLPKTKNELKDIIVDSLKQGNTDLNFIDTSKITDMSYLFYNINYDIKIKDIDISEWDVSNVINMRYMFDKCEEFNSDLSKWNVSKATSIRYMFNNCKEFNSNISNWDVSNVINMIGTFMNCENFDQDLNKWNPKKLNYALRTFSGTKLQKENKLPVWYNKLYESILDDDEDIDNKKLSIQPKTREELLKIIFNALDNGETDLNYIDTSLITDMHGLFVTLNKINNYLNIDISEWNVSNVQDMSHMFKRYKNFNCDLSKWDVSNVLYMDGMFSFCENFTGKGLDKWDVSNVENMGLMFKCTPFNLDISNWDVSNVKDMFGMFKMTTEFNQDISKWNINKVTDMSNMFYKALKFNKNISKINLNHDVFLENMFYKAEKFKPKKITLLSKSHDILEQYFKK